MTDVMFESEFPHRESPMPRFPAGTPITVEVRRMGWTRPRRVAAEYVRPYTAMGAHDEAVIRFTDDAAFAAGTECAVPNRTIARF